jgi:putative transcription factor
MTDHQKIAKLDRENEVAPPPKISLSVGKAIQQARQAKSLTQKELGQKINEKSNIVSDIKKQYAFNHLNINYSFIFKD